jgi:hypothetical protein
MRLRTMTAVTAVLVTVSITTASAVPGVPTSSASAPAAPSGLILWDIGSESRFDSTNKAYPIEASGAVTVDLKSPVAVCPTGLGGLASGRPSVKRIALQFATAAGSTCWLHIRWDGGGSGIEQFDVLLDGKPVGQSTRVDAAKEPERPIVDSFQLDVPAGAHEIALVHLSGDGLRFSLLALTTAASPPLANKPTLEFPTLAAYEKEIQEPGIVLDNGCVRLFAPKTRQREATIIHGYLAKAYDHLHRMTGLNTQYRIVVYHFPESNPHFSGGTSLCTIRYGYNNLDLSAQPEWKQYGVPHMSGEIEEMAHNFVDAAHVQFGWEMVGWSIGVETTEAVAPNPIFARDVRQTRAGQAQTFARYNQSGFVFPPDLPANQVDRIHAHLLGLCRERYGPRFWPDFFAEVAKRQDQFAAASKLSGDDGRNARYKLCVECFDALKGLNFRTLLKYYGISETTDVKALHPEEPSWDRRLTARGERIGQPR